MKKNSVILVTGVSSGIGGAIAQRLSSAGHRVFGTARSMSRSGPTGVEMLELDVCSDDSVRKGVDHVLKTAGGLDVLINNAGYLLAGAVEEATVDEAKAQFETNFFGVMRMVKAVLPTLRKQRSGHILTVSSLAGISPVPFWAYYNASKFAVEGLLETLRHELKPFNIKVTMVEPGAIKTRFYSPKGAAPMAEYSPWRERMMNTMKDFENKAPGPEVVAARVAAILAQASPSLRHGITREAILFPLLRWLLPAGAYELGVRKGFHLDG